MGRQSRLKAERRAWRAAHVRRLLTQCGQKDCTLPPEWEGIMRQEEDVAGKPGVRQVREVPARACELHKVQSEVLGVGRAWRPLSPPPSLSAEAVRIYDEVAARLEKRQGATTPSDAQQAQPAPVD